MKRISLNTILLLLVIGLFSCKNSDNTSQAEQSEDLSTKKTQALILAQSFDFNPSDKNKVTGKYAAQTKLTIPQNLAIQSKWIMFEEPVLENDVIAYRYYVDIRHRFNIYEKPIADLVMDTMSWKYHDNMDWGIDILKVGNFTKGLAKQGVKVFTLDLNASIFSLLAKIVKEPNY